MRVVQRALICGIAGALAWLLVEPFFPKDLAFRNDPRWVQVEYIFFATLGAFIGLVGGLDYGRQRGGTRNIALAGGLGLLCGVIGALIGHAVGGVVFSLLSPIPGMGWLARIAAITPAGMLLGLAIGITLMSARGALSGAVGGAIGGFVTGALFDPVSLALGTFIIIGAGPGAAGGATEVGAPGRAVLAFGLGLSIGLFTEVMNRITRQAWMRLELGRNEGREWPLDAEQTFIGRDERAHIPLFGDPHVAPMHAVVVRTRSGYWLQDPGTPLGVGLNGQKLIGQVMLTSGDLVQVGSHRLVFMLKSGQRASRHQGPVAIKPYPLPDQPGGVAVPHAVAPVPTTAWTPTPPSYCLVALSGPLSGQRFAVSQPLELGREAAGLPLSFDPSVSRRHALLAPAQVGLTITDLGSTNGTFLNRQRVQQAVATLGDVLKVGSTEFRVEPGHHPLQHQQT